MTVNLDPLKQTKTILLTTYKRNGTGVSTPVSIAFDGDRAFFRTWHKAGKAKRLANNPTVEVSPCSVFGRVDGPTLRAKVRLLQSADASRAASALAARHQVLQAVLVPLVHRLMNYRTLHYELIAIDRAD